MSRARSYDPPARARFPAAATCEMWSAGNGNGGKEEDESASARRWEIGSVVSPLRTPGSGGGGQVASRARTRTHAKHVIPPERVCVPILHDAREGERWQNLIPPAATVDRWATEGEERRPRASSDPPTDRLPSSLPSSRARRGRRRQRTSASIVGIRGSSAHLRTHAHAA